MNQEPQATGPGIVVLSTSFELLHINRRAMALLTQVARLAQSVGAEQAVTAPLRQHCQDIIKTMHARLAADNWERFHQYRIIGDPARTILLKGFGLPERRGLPHSRIVILLTPHTPLSPPENSRAESPEWVFESNNADADSPPAIGM